MNDVDAFGSFMNAFVITLRDEYPKLASVTFPVMSNSTSQALDVRSQDFHSESYFTHMLHQAQKTGQLFNEAMYLRTLNEYSSMNIPIKHPARWDKSLWGEPLNFSVCPSSTFCHD